jgi:hypothetical protein
VKNKEESVLYHTTIQHESTQTEEINLKIYDSGYFGPRTEPTLAKYRTKALPMYLDVSNNTYIVKIKCVT